MADDVLAVADAVAFPRFVLVAHSFGTAVAAQFAGRHAHRLAGLVLVDGGYWIPTSEETEELARGFEEANYRAFTDAWFEPILVNARPETRAAVLDSPRATPRGGVRGIDVRQHGLRPAPGDTGVHRAKLVIAASALDGPTMFQRALPEIRFHARRWREPLGDDGRTGCVQREVGRVSRGDPVVSLTASGYVPPGAEPLHPRRGAG